MWLFTKTGYISAVENQDDKKTVILRARVHGDLKAFRLKYMGPTNAKITYHEGNDYPYRLVCRKTEFASAMVNAVADIDYKNFKSAVSKIQGHARSGIYTRIWAVLTDLERNKKRLTNYFKKQTSLLKIDDRNYLDLPSTHSKRLGAWHGPEYYDSFVQHSGDDRKDTR